MGEEIPRYFRGQGRLDADRWIGPAGIGDELNMNRRHFALGAVSALSAARVVGASERVRMGLIGSGGRGREDWTTFLKQPEVEPVAVCDVYAPFLAKGIAMTEGRGEARPGFPAAA